MAEVGALLRAVVLSGAQRQACCPLCLPFTITARPQVALKGWLTWTCLQSWPRAGSWMRRNVMGHFRDTLMAVCSTPSSPLRVVLPDEAATLLKFRLTVGGGGGTGG